MALPRKGTRKIQVDGEEYRWRIRNKPTYCPRFFGSSMTFAVESVRQPKRVLLVNTGLSRPDSLVTAERGTISPMHVAEAIRRALRRGWRPDSSGSALMLEVDLFDLEKDGTGRKLQTPETSHALRI